MDVYNRLQVEEGSFKLPHDMEVSQAELREHCETASNWRGQNGAFRKIHVATYGKEQEVSLFLSRLYSLLMHVSGVPVSCFRGFPPFSGLHTVFFFCSMDWWCGVCLPFCAPGLAQGRLQRLSVTESGAQR